MRTQQNHNKWLKKTKKFLLYKLKVIFDAAICNMRKIATHLRLYSLFILFVFIGEAANGQFRFLSTVPKPGALAISTSGNFITLNVKAKRNIIIKEFWVPFANLSTTNYRIWYKTDSLNGTPSVSVVNGWIPTTWSSFSPPVAGFANLVRIPTTLNINIPAGATYAFAIEANGIMYINSGAPNVPPYKFQDFDAVINTGGQVGFGGSISSPLANRKFCGKIGYDIVPIGMNNAAVEGVFKPDSMPSSGNYDVMAKIRNSGKNLISIVTVQWSINGLLQTPISLICPLDTFGTPGGTSDTLIHLGYLFFSNGQRTAIKVWTEQPNYLLDSLRGDDTSSSVFMPKFSGSYSIGGPTPSYPSLAALASDISIFGISGPVYIQINSGLYSGGVLFKDVEGSNPTNTITISGVNKSTCVFSDSLNAPILSFINTGYVTLRDVTVINNGIQAAVGIHLLSLNHENARLTQFTISNCSVYIPNSTHVNSAGLYVSGDLLSGLHTNKFDSICIDSNTITGAYAGIVCGGQNFSIYANRGFIISNNFITNPLAYGIRLWQTSSGVTVKRNTITMRSGPTMQSYGMHLTDITNFDSIQPIEIIENKLINCGYMGMYLYIFQNTIPSTKIYNNAVSGNMTYTTNYGLNLFVNGPLEVFHNSVHINGSGAYQFGLNVERSVNTAPIAIKNNIFSIYSTTGSSLFPLAITPSPPGKVLNYNLYYNARNNNLILRGGVIYMVSNYKLNTSGGDSSFNFQPPFFNNTELKLNNGCIQGVDLSIKVPYDYFGTTRSLSPSLGYHEFETQYNDLRIEKIVSPVLPLSPGSQNLLVKVRNVGNSTIRSFQLSHKVNYGAPVTISWAGTLNPCDTAYVLFSGSNQIVLAAGANQIQVYSSNPDSMMDGNVYNDTIRLGNLPPLPVTLTNFVGRRLDNMVMLNWTTAMEKNNKGFDVERSVDGSNFQPVGFVPSHYINSNQMLHYGYMDDHAPSSKLFYRLKQIDLDGKYAYSPIIEIRSIDMVKEINVYPNPFENVITIANLTQESGEITIYDLLGKKLIGQNFPANENIELMAVSDFKPGIYFVQINENQPVKFIKR